jgi:hypothetical protein
MEHTFHVLNKLSVFFPFVNMLFTIFQKISAQMSHNVPAVCDGLAARIRKCAAFPGPTNCAGAMAWEWSAAE